MDKPRLKYKILIDDSGNEYMNRVMVGTAVTGLVRIEWVMGRYGQAIPPNWSMTTWQAWLSSYNPLHYQVADAQNLITKVAIEKDYQWLLLIEHDNILPPDCFLRFNEYIIKADTPVVSGLYYTRARPSEPLIFRGRGNSTFRDFKLGDLVWADGVPTGVLLVHVGLLKAMWDESPEYLLAGTVVRRVFETPTMAFMTPEGNYKQASGTSDIYWCDRVMKGDYFRKAGWSKFADAHPEYPFLVDTNIFSKHISQDGEQFP